MDKLKSRLEEKKEMDAMRAATIATMIEQMGKVWLVVGNHIANAGRPNPSRARVENSSGEGTFVASLLSDDLYNRTLTRRNPRFW